MPQPKHPPVKLTKGYIDKVKPPDTGYEFHWDSTVKGYGLRVTKDGRRVFVANGRVKGKQVNLTIGPFGELTEVEAREKARKALQQMREGVDPRDTRRQREADLVTLSAVCVEYVSRPGKLKESSRKAIERHVVTTLAKWKEKPVTAITEEAVRQQYRKLLTKGLHGKRAGGSPGQANQAFSVLRALLNYAARRYRKTDGSPLILRNPVDALRDEWVELQPRTTAIPMDKVGAVWSALRRWSKEPNTRPKAASIDFLMLLMLTGCRREETASITWDQVHVDTDPSKCWLHLPDTKNNNPVWLPLSTQAVEVLKNRPKVEGSPYVFATWSKRGYIQNPLVTLAHISKMAGVPISNHDIRRTYSQIAYSSCGVDFHKIELLTNHVPKGVTARHYLETSRLQYLYPEAQRIGDWIEAQAAIAEGGNVIRITA
jgi:integrase